MADKSKTGSGGPERIKTPEDLRQDLKNPSSPRFRETQGDVRADLRNPISSKLAKTSESVRPDLTSPSGPKLIKTAEDIRRDLNSPHSNMTKQIMVLILSDGLQKMMMRTHPTQSLSERFMKYLSKRYMRLKKAGLMAGAYESSQEGAVKGKKSQGLIDYVDSVLSPIKDPKTGQVLDLDKLDQECEEIIDKAKEVIGRNTDVIVVSLKRELQGLIKKDPKVAGVVDKFDQKARLRPADAMVLASYQYSAAVSRLSKQPQPELTMSKAQREEEEQERQDLWARAPGLNSMHEQLILHKFIRSFLPPEKWAEMDAAVAKVYSEIEGQSIRLEPQPNDFVSTQKLRLRMAVRTCSSESTEVSAKEVGFQLMTNIMQTLGSRVGMASVASQQRPQPEEKTGEAEASPSRTPRLVPRGYK